MSKHFSLSLLAFLAVPLPATAQGNAEAEVKALAAQLTKPAPIQTLDLRAAAPNREATAVLVVRSANPKVGAQEVETFTQELRSAMAGGPIKLTTLSELNADSLSASSSNEAVVSRAQSLGVDHVLFADIASMNLRSTQVSGRSIQQIDLRGGLTLHSASRGAQLQSISESVSKRGFDPQNLAIEAFAKLGAGLAQKTKTWTAMAPAGKPVAVEVRVKIDGLQLPFLPGPDEAVTQQPLTLYADGASVELDGVLIGQAPCRFEVWPGLHRLRVSREGIGSREANVQINEPCRHDLSLSPDDKARQGFISQLAVMEQIRQQQREGRQREELLRAKAEAMRGFAAFLRQSGLRLDYRKIDDEDKLSTLPAAPESKANAPSSTPKP